MKRILTGFVLIAMTIASGCSTPYMGAQNAFFKGDPVKAEEILLPVYEKELEKDNRNKNLYLWDMAVYKFFQGNFEGAIDDFHKSVIDYEGLDDAGRTAAKMFTSASAQKYVGDPVEISLAYFHLGLSYYMVGNYQNASIGFRRAIEEDLSKDEARHGDLAVVNFFLGECAKRLRKGNEAKVGYKRAIEYSEDFLPAYVGLHRVLMDTGDLSDIGLVEDRIVQLAGRDYLDAIKADKDEQGILVMVTAGRASKVSGDALLGSFRVRNEMKYKPHSYNVTVNAEASSDKLFLADNLHEDFKDQGGAGDEARQQGTRAVVAQGMSMIPCVAAFAPDTKADIRHWVTLPTKYHITYMPMDPGTYDLSLCAFSSGGSRLPGYDLSAEGVVVNDSEKTTMIISSYGAVAKRRIEEQESEEQEQE